MVDHAALIPSFRDFSGYRPESFGPQLPEPRKPTVLEVESILRDSPAGKLGQAVSTEGWPWLERMDFLDAVIPGLKVHSLGSMEPFQADGIWGPYEWYYRERGGGSTLRLDTIGTFPGLSGALYGSFGDSEYFAGTTGWLNNFLKLWERLEVDSFLYEFDSKQVSIERIGDEASPDFEFRQTGKSEVSYGRGHSPEEAWDRSSGYSSYLEEKIGLTREHQAEYRARREVSRTPLNSDERVFPAETPDFTVNWSALKVPEELKRFVEHYTPEYIEAE